MNTAEAIRRLHAERMDWRKAKLGGGPEVSWTVNGLTRAIAIIEKIADEERNRNRILRPMVSHWRAGYLYRCCKNALNYINRGDRARAIETLTKAVRSIEDEAKP